VGTLVGNLSFYYNPSSISRIIIDFLFFAYLHSKRETWIFPKVKAGKDLGGGVAALRRTTKSEAQRRDWGKAAFP
jgi:hypothetical protein